MVPGLGKGGAGVEEELDEHEAAGDAAPEEGDVVLARLRDFEVMRRGSGEERDKV